LGEETTTTETAEMDLEEEIAVLRELLEER
jgi:hypothetical protein